MDDGKRQDLDAFLAGVERRAFRMVHLATGSTDEALDIVQDAMLALVQHYGNKPAEQWKLLFHRIVQNRIRDWRRRQWVRRRLLAWFGAGPGEMETPDVPDPGPSAADQAIAREDMAAVEAALRSLPLRQQQAFMLRAWEDLSVAQTAEAMGCTAGSVKTHYFRAVNALRGRLEGQDAGRSDRTD